MGGLRQAVSEGILARKNLNWSLPNSRLFNETFTGCARAIPRCIFCLQDDHTTSTWTINPNRPAPWDVSYWPAQTAMGYVPCSVQAEVCHNYNDGRCKESNLPLPACVSGMPPETHAWLDCPRRCPHIRDIGAEPVRHVIAAPTSPSHLSILPLPTHTPNPTLALMLWCYKNGIVL